MTTMIIISVVLVAIVVYMMYNNMGVETFSGGMDPSARFAIASIGPSYDEKETYCGSCL